MQSIARCHIDRQLQFVLEILLDADEVEGVEPALRVVIDEQVEIA